MSGAIKKHRRIEAEWPEFGWAERPPVSATVLEMLRIPWHFYSRHCPTLTGQVFIFCGRVSWCSDRSRARWSARGMPSFAMSAELPPRGARRSSSLTYPRSLATGSPTQ